jgi:hypothetical protein
LGFKRFDHVIPGCIELELDEILSQRETCLGSLIAKKKLTVESTARFDRSNKKMMKFLSSSLKRILTNIFERRGYAQKFNDLGNSKFITNYNIGQNTVI